MGEVEYRCIEGSAPESFWQALAQTNQEIFGFDETAGHLATFYALRPGFVAHVALVDGAMVGFKLGYRRSDSVFESDRGGVRPDARRQGVATALMLRQHQWCQEKGFKTIKTVTNADNRAMLILNLRSGFEIVGCVMSRRNRLKVLLEKPL